MQHANSEETPSYTREELLARIRTALAGRAAEQVFYGREKALNTGASSDLKQASNLAFHIICTYAMEENQYVVLSREEILKSSMAGDYIRQVNELLRQEMANTIALIEDGKDVVQAIADELLKENHLTGEQFKTLIKAQKTDLPQ
jgi:ATP-dependent Zn protease